LKDKFWAYMLARGSNMSRFHGDRDSAIALVSQLLCKDPIVLELQKELVDEGKNLDETSVGSYVSGNLEKLKERYEQELASLEKLRRELLESDRAMKWKIQRDCEEERARLRQAQEQQVSLQRPVSSEVRQKISATKEVKSGIMKVLPFIPSVISILGLFVGIPPGVTDIFIPGSHPQALISQPLLI
jgi:hypothetical protein